MSLLYLFLIITFFCTFWGLYTNMDETIINEVVEYENGIPCHILTATKDSIIKSYKDYKVRVPLHWHTDVEINIPFWESPSMQIDGKSVTSKNGGFVIINSGSIHGNTQAVNDLIDDVPDILGVTLRISNSFFKKLIPNFDILEFNTIWEPSTNRPKEIAMELTKYGYPNVRLDKYENILIDSLIYELIYYLVKENLRLKENNLSDIEKKNQNCIREAMQYIEHNYRNPINEKDLADKFNYTPTYFSKMFKKYSNITYKEYLLITRLSAAKQQLIDTNLSITDIAMDCGFSDVRGLINTFKKYEGTTPTAFRKYQMSKI